MSHGSLTTRQSAAVDDLLTKVPLLQELASAPDLLGKLVKDFAEFSSGLFDEFKVTAANQLKKIVFSQALTFLASKLTPGFGVISSIYSGAQWLLTGETIVKFRDLLVSFFGQIDKILAGPPPNTGAIIKDLMNQATPLVLGFLATQMKIQDLPQKVMDMVKAVDLRVWIQTAVEKLWTSLRESAPVKAILEKITGRVLSERIPIGDPWLIWAVQRGDSHIQVLIDGQPLLDRLARWEAAPGQKPEAIAAIANLEPYIKDLEALKSTARGSAEFKALLGTFRALASARKSSPQQVSVLESEVAKHKREVSLVVSALAGPLNEIVRQLTPGSGQSLNRADFQFSPNPLVAEARQYRLDNRTNVSKAQNVVVMEYIDPLTRRRKTMAGYSVPTDDRSPTGHAEQFTYKLILAETNGRVPIITRVYSEFSPCSKKAFNCSLFLREVAPNADIFFTWDYGSAFERRQKVDVIGEFLR